jgi:hypothetical protein
MRLDRCICFAMALLMATSGMTETVHWQQAAAQIAICSA